jgi:Nuclease-related domain/AAA domain/UvrD-like helicase C-terminal domain
MGDAGLRQSAVMGDPVDRAGASAADLAYQTELDIDAITTQILGLTQLARRKRGEQHAWASGGAGELAVARLLAGMDEAGWHLLLDRRWPGTTLANIDVLAIGPGGVFVIDAKNWRHPRIEGGHLWNGQALADEATDKLHAQTAAIEALLSDEGLAPGEVVPLMVFVGARRVSSELGRVRILGSLELAPTLARYGLRLSAEQVARLVAVLDKACPPNAAGRTAARRPAHPRHAAPSVLSEVSGASAHETPDTLFDEAAIIEALREAAAREPVESWMTWLHPVQANLARQSWNGPARLRGAAGTGKSVVALHRARYLAATGRRVLFTSFVGTLPRVQGELFAGLAPELTGRVEFIGVHAWAMRLLASRGIAVSVDSNALQTCFTLAWGPPGRGAALSGLGCAPGYWWDEVQSVIKGRGLTSAEDYAALVRVGRGTPLQPIHRQVVWARFCEYERLRRERGLHDWSDVLLLALESVRREPPDPAYDAVIVDEVQDLTCVGAQLLHALVGDASDGLYLVGDGQQAIYPGGYSLAEAGVSVVGRARLLDRNYRNGGDILRAALAVVADDAYDDLEVDRFLGVRLVDVERPGGEVIRVKADNAESQKAALTAQVRDANEVEGVRLGDMAVLCPTNNAVSSWRRALERAGVPTLALADYSGRTTDAVKVGTFHRAKGLEFAFVLIPDRDRVPSPKKPLESEDAFRERAQLERRQLFVAMTRARDGLWLGSTT